MNSNVYKNLRLDLEAMAEPTVRMSNGSRSAVVPGHRNSRCTTARSTTAEDLHRFARNSLAEAASFEALALQAEQDQDAKRSNGLDALALEFYGVTIPFLDKQAFRVITALYEARNPEAKS